MIVFAEYPKQLITNTLGTNKWLKQGHRVQVNIQESIAFLGISDGQLEFEIKSTTPVTL